MLTFIRWLLFLPAGFAASVVCRFLFGSVGASFSEFLGFVTAGIVGAAAFVSVGLVVAPKRISPVKWTLVVASAIFGLVLTFQEMHGDDKLEMATGISMVLSSFAYGRVSSHELTMGA